MPWTHNLWIRSRCDIKYTYNVYHSFCFIGQMGWWIWCYFNMCFSGSSIKLFSCSVIHMFSSNQSISKEKYVYVFAYNVHKNICVLNWYSKIEYILSYILTYIVSCHNACCVDYWHYLQVLNYISVLNVFTYTQNNNYHATLYLINIERSPLKLLNVFWNAFYLGAKIYMCSVGCDKLIRIGDGSTTGRMRVAVDDSPKEIYEFIWSI